MASIAIIVGSVYGNAQNVAEYAKQQLTGEGHDVEVETDPDLDILTAHDVLMVVTSTTGMGDVPPNLELFFSDVQDSMPMLNGKPFVIFGLGDSSYGDSYCGAGKQFFTLFEELQGSALSPLVELDAMETFEPEKDVVDWLEQNKSLFN